jgi:glycoprotein 2-beta-D-xylosyltransferase
MARKFDTADRTGSLNLINQNAERVAQGEAVQQQQQQQQQPYQAGRTMELPDWLRGHLDNKAISRRNTFDHQFVEPQCRTFNHTIMRPTHGCQVNPDTNMVFCNFRNLRVDVSKIISDLGGEPLESVMGREEAAEMPVYEKGAFSTDQRPTFEVARKYRNHLHYMENVLNNLRYPTKENEGVVDMTCTETVSGTTLFLTRYEYVNLYHTMTDWWNAYFAMPPGSSNNNLRVVFLDAHAQGNLDSAWTQMFGKTTFVQHLPKGGVCFERAIFIPAGYSSPLFPDNRDPPRLRCPLDRLADEFSKHVLQSYGLQDVNRIAGKIVIIDRKSYVAHPRSKPGQVKRIISNLEELKKSLVELKRVTSVNVVRLETMTLGEQISAIREAHVLIGNHGAGLSHVLFMDRKSHLIEFTKEYLEFFSYMSEWKGVQYTVIPLVDSSRLASSDIERVVGTVAKIIAEDHKQ